MATLPQLVVLFFGALIVLFSVWSMIFPQRLLRFVKAITDTTTGYYFAAGVRLVLGIALLWAAQESRFPAVFQVIGWLTIAAAIGILLVGRGPLRKLVAWLGRLSDTSVRLWLVIGIAFGAFLIYGVV